jgi:hypothetical protein
MRNPTGYAQIVSDNPVVEYDTTTCCHCGRAIVTKPGSASTVYLVVGPSGLWQEEPGASCFRCMKPVCLRCHAIGYCLPLEKWLQQQERHRPHQGV